MRKKVMQKPQQAKREREELMTLERVVNVALSEIDPEYKIAQLVRRPNGTVEFETAVKFKTQHREAVGRAFAILDDAGSDRSA